MATVQPEGEKIRQAIKWISNRLKEDGGKRPGKFIDEAGARFNLSPKEEEFLRSFYK